MKLVSSRFKFVGVILLLGWVLGFAAELNGCWTHTLTSSSQPCGHCPNMSPMATDGAVSANLHATSPTASCCRVAPKRPAPISNLITPDDGSRVPHTNVA